jgi:CRISPR-associated exonuclease Cas4
MQITGTHINYYFICHRKLWLFANGIQMEQSSDLVSEGKLVHETSYMQRSEKFEEIEIGPVKIDFYDPKNKIVHEVKLSNKIETAHEWQIKYYLYILEKAGIDGVSGILEYPKLRKTNEIYLSNKDRNEIKEIVAKIHHIIALEECPPLAQKKICNKCSYHDFCYANEME